MHSELKSFGERVAATWNEIVDYLDRLNDEDAQAQRSEDGALLGEVVA